jgi:predicted phage tail protein
MPSNIDIQALRHIKTELSNIATHMSQGHDQVQLANTTSTHVTQLDSQHLESWTTTHTFWIANSKATHTNSGICTTHDCHSPVAYVVLGVLDSRSAVHIT